MDLISLQRGQRQHGCKCVGTQMLDGFGSRYFARHASQHAFIPLHQFRRPRCALLIIASTLLAIFSDFGGGGGWLDRDDALVDGIAGENHAVFHGRVACNGFIGRVVRTQCLAHVARQNVANLGGQPLRLIAAFENDVDTTPTVEFLGTAFAVGQFQYIVHGVGNKRLHAKVRFAPKLEFGIDPKGQVGRRHHKPQHATVERHVLKVGVKQGRAIVKTAAGLEKVVQSVDRVVFVDHDFAWK